jgi:vitamin B12 transporter
MRVSRFGFALLLLPVRLSGQQPTDTVELNPVVVTATRVPRPVTDVPAAVTVLRGEDLRAQGIRTVFEALREAPGAAVVQTGSFGGQTSLFLRGGQSNYVKVLIDGVPVNQPGGAFDFANLTTDNVERIEVVRGPASVLYGSDAVTGVVQIFTRRGANASRAEASVRGGTYGTLAWNAETSGGSQGASYSVALSHFSSDGAYAFNNQYHNTVFSGLARVAPDDRTDATLSLRYGDAAFHFPTNGAGVPVDHNQFSYGSGPTLGLDLGHYFTKGFEARLLVATNATSGGFDDRPDSAADSSRFQNLDDVRRSSADLRGNLYVSSGMVVTLGTAVEQEHYRSFNVCQTSFGDCTTPPIEVTRWNTALYGQVVGDVLTRVSFTAGVRVEDNERFGTYVTYRLGSVYRIAGGTRLRATAGTGFREPSFFENYSTGFTVGNPNLAPERSRNWEVGLEQTALEGRASFSATVFNQRFIDMIDYDPGAAFGAVNYFNVAGATADGVELAVRAAPGAGGALSLGASYSYLYTNVTRSGFDSSSGALLAVGQPLVRRPKHAARLDADYRILRRGSASLSALYVGEREDQDFSAFPAPRVILPSYVRVDLATQLDVLRPRGSAPGVAVSARVENVLDHRYEEVKNFPARGRTLLFGGRVGWGL